MVYIKQSYRDTPGGSGSWPSGTEGGEKFIILWIGSTEAEWISEGFEHGPERTTRDLHSIGGFRAEDLLTDAGSRMDPGARGTPPF
jgi:hypothetical protein